MDSYKATLKALGERARDLRMVRQLRQDELAQRAGVGVATIHRFETTGRASLENVLRIAAALRTEGAFDRLFEPPPYASIDEAIARPIKRRRVRRRQASK